MKEKAIILDANIVIRGVLGAKVYNLLEKSYQHIQLHVPDICFDEVRKHLPAICKKRNIPLKPTLETLNYLTPFFNVVESCFYSAHEQEAKARIEIRDVNDWPIVATALLYECPIWTEDNDFFGTGVASWTTDRVHLYLLK